MDSFAKRVRITIRNTRDYIAAAKVKSRGKLNAVDQIFSEAIPHGVIYTYGIRNFKLN